MLTLTLTLTLTPTLTLTLALALTLSLTLLLLLTLTLTLTLTPNPNPNQVTLYRADWGWATGTRQLTGAALAVSGLAPARDRVSRIELGIGERIRPG